MGRPEPPFGEGLGPPPAVPRPCWAALPLLQGPPAQPTSALPAPACTGRHPGARGLVGDRVGVGLGEGSCGSPQASPRVAGDFSPAR